MKVKPFLKWAGGKRWLAEREGFELPAYPGRYIEPFLGGGAIFFSHAPKSAILSDVNGRLIETYQAIKTSPDDMQQALAVHHSAHSKEHYYAERARVYTSPFDRAVQFLYLNRACWNGLYRENLKGQFNVPIGTKSAIVLDDEDFELISQRLQTAVLHACDFEATVDLAHDGDLLFIDPPYTTAHNFNGFVKYNQKIFTWDDQVRLHSCISRAAKRGAKVLVTNADHPSIVDLYRDTGEQRKIFRPSVISGKVTGRQLTSELLISCNI